MFEAGAVPSKDGAGRGSDGEGLAGPSHEEPQSQQQLVTLLDSSTRADPLNAYLLMDEPWLELRLGKRSISKQCRVCEKTRKNLWIHTRVVCFPFSSGPWSCDIQ